VVCAGEVIALDIGAGTGILSLLAASAGVDMAVAAEVHPTLCRVRHAVTQLAHKFTQALLVFF
jgi:predicted RNA methylase